MSQSATKTWTWRHAICAATDLPPTTKHVLLTLSMFMNEFGESCFPPVSDLVKYSSLDKKTVIKHLGIARDKGWVAVSLHGFRGQRWKRKEYSARWPERDLLAPCGPEDEQLKAQKGGGAVPPPSNEKVVDVVPEGGGAGSQKVVEHVPQDKNIPDNIPITSPIEREGVREGATGEAGSTSKPLPAAKANRIFNRLVHNWPGNKGSSTKQAIREFEQLSASDQESALARRDDWIALLRSQGRTLFPAPSTYLSDKLWEQVPAGFAKAAKDDEPVVAPKFGKMWNAVRFSELLRPPAPFDQRLTILQEDWVAKGLETRQSILLKRQAEQGWKAVNSMHEAAIRRHRDWRGDASLVPLLPLFVQVSKGSDVWEAWKQLHANLGWPWLGEDRDCPPFVWMPAPPGDPPDYSTPEDAVRAALARFETEHATITQKDAAE